MKGDESKDRGLKQKLEMRGSSGGKTKGVDPYIRRFAAAKRGMRGGDDDDGFDRDGARLSLSVGL